MVITGGFRTFSGPVVGAVFIEILSEELRAWGEIRMVVFAVFVLAIARAYPAGLVGLGAAAARGLTLAVPRLAPLLAARRPED
jgi:ABC-type branched-subunit amino acid transport system permease subunit